MEVDPVFVSGAMVGRTTMHEWGCPSLCVQCGTEWPHEWSIPTAFHGGHPRGNWSWKLARQTVWLNAGVTLHLGSSGWGWGSKMVVTFNHRGCLNNSIFWNLGLFAACWACFTCHHKLWPTSVSHTFFSLNNPLGLAGGTHYQKITIPIFFLKFLLFQVAFLIFFSLTIFSPYFLLVGLLLQCMTISVRGLVKLV